MFKRKKRRPFPMKPVNVRLVCADGSVVPVDLTYNGFVDGVHEWRVVLAHAPDDRISRVLADEIPLRAAIVFPVGGE